MSLLLQFPDEYYSTLASDGLPVRKSSRKNTGRRASSRTRTQPYKLKVTSPDNVSLMLPRAGRMRIDTTASGSLDGTLDRMQSKDDFRAIYAVLRESGASAAHRPSSDRLGYDDTTETEREKELEKFTHLFMNFYRSISDKVAAATVVQSNLNEKVKNVGTEQSKELNELHSDLECFRDAVFDLGRRLRVIEDATILKYKDQPILKPLVFQQQSAQFRFYVVDGFMTIFPLIFKSNELNHSFDPVGTNVNWAKFLAVLRRHFRAHHHMKEDETDTLRWTPVRSVFSTCTPVIELLKIGDADITKSASYDYQGVVDEADSSFQEEYVIDAEVFPNPDGPSSMWRQGSGIGDSDAQVLELMNLKFHALKLEMKFFVPALIWAYCEHKSYASAYDREIRSYEETKQVQEQLITPQGNSLTALSGAETTTEAEQDILSRFTLGTALELRKKLRREKANWESHMKTNRKDIAVITSPSPDDIRPESLFVPASRKGMAQGAGIDNDDSDGAASHGVISPRKPRKRVDSSRSSSSSESSRNINSNPPRSISSLLGSGRRSAEDALNALRVANAKSALEHYERWIALITEGRRRCVDNLDRIHRCLAILLDDDLLNFVLIADKLVGYITNKEKQMDVTKDAELIRHCLQYNRDNPSKMPDVGVLVEKLASLRTENFHDKGDVSVDNAIDQYMASETKVEESMDFIHSMPNVIGSLAMMMELLHPVPAYW